MRIDWQVIAVSLIILAACGYVARRGYTRLRSFGQSKSAASCETGCGSCASTTQAATRPALVGISPLRTATRKTSTPRP